MAQITAAGELMVIEVVTLGERNLVEERFHVGKRADGHATFADFAFGERMVGVIAHQRGQIEGDGEAGLALREQDSGSARWCRGPSRSRRTGAWSRIARGTLWGGFRGCKEVTPARRGRVPDSNRRGRRPYKDAESDNWRRL